MNSIANTNIEKAVISSILYNPEEIETIGKFLSHEDFYLPAHQKIFKVMCDLHKEDLPIDDEFIRRRVDKKEVDDSILIEILSTTPISNSLAYVKEIQEGAKKRELATLATDIKKLTLEDNNSFDSTIQHLKKKLDFLENKSVAQNTSLHWKDGLEKCKSILTFEMLENIEESNSLVKGFVFEQTLSVFHSKPGTGKTTLLLGLAKLMIHQNTIDEIIYFDADNPLSVLKNRLPKLQNTFGDKLTYHTHTSSSYEALREEMKRLTLYANQGKRCLVILDTFGKLANAMKDEESKPLMDLGGELRDKFGATVIFVHHSNKNESETGKPIFRGSTVIHGDCDFMWGMKRDGSNLTIYNDKGRLDYFEKIKAEVSLKNYDVDLDGSYDLHDDQPIEESNDDITIFTLRKYMSDKDWISMTEIRKHFNCTRKDRESHKEKRDLIWNLIQDNKNVFEWNGIGGNKAKYKIITKEPEIVVYNDTKNVDMPHI